MKIILLVREGVVERAKEISDEMYARVLPTHPYRADTDLGNEYATMLRKKDIEHSRGIKCEVIVKDTGSVYDYIHKKYNEKTGEVELMHDDDVARMQEMMVRGAYYRIPSLFTNLIPTIEQIAQMKVVAASMGKADVLDKAILTLTQGGGDKQHWVLLEPDLSELSKIVDAMPEEIRLVAAIIIASNITNKNHQIPKETKIAWWNKLKGTSQELRALSGIAGVHAMFKDYEAAVTVYDALRVNPAITKEQQQEIDERIFAIGRGQGEFSKVKELCEAALQKKEEAQAYYRKKAAGVILETDVEVKEGLIKAVNDAQKAIDAFTQLATGLTLMEYGAQVEKWRGLIRWVL